MLWDTFILALREIRRHVLRSLLTVLGIVIGVASVIIMVTLGITLRHSAIPKQYLSVLYNGLGIGLFLSGTLYIMTSLKLMSFNHK